MDEPASERITTQEIIDAITTTLANARAEGEPYQSKAEEHLAAFEAILLRIGIESRHAGDSIKRENSELTLLDQKATTLIDAHADDIWARLGCPDYDPIYNILFPSALTGHHTLSNQSRTFVRAGGFTEQRHTPKNRPRLRQCHCPRDSRARHRIQRSSVRLGKTPITKNIARSFRSFGRPYWAFGTRYVAPNITEYGYGRIGNQIRRAPTHIDSTHGAEKQSLIIRQMVSTYALAFSQVCQGTCGATKPRHRAFPCAAS
jgi:hypothetical protein